MSHRPKASGDDQALVSYGRGSVPPKVDLSDQLNSQLDLVHDLMRELRSESYFNEDLMRAVRGVLRTFSDEASILQEANAEEDQLRDKVDEGKFALSTAAKAIDLDRQKWRMKGESINNFFTRPIVDVNSWLGELEPTKLFHQGSNRLGWYDNSKLWVQSILSMLDGFCSQWSVAEMNALARDPKVRARIRALVAAKGKLVKDQEAKPSKDDQSKGHWKDLHDECHSFMRILTAWSERLPNPPAEPSRDERGLVVRPNPTLRRAQTEGEGVQSRAFEPARRTYDRPPVTTPPSASRRYSTTAQTGSARAPRRVSFSEQVDRQ